MKRITLLLALALSMLPVAAAAQVLGACGTSDADQPTAAPEPGQVTRVPLPGEQAPNFELPAVVGDEIKNIRLSDYSGKWRVVCFYPADFTFV